MLEEIFEGKCPACGSASRLNLPLCNSCIEEIEKPSEFCYECGFAFTKEKRCPICGGVLSYIDKVYTLFKYTYPIRDLILSIKFKYNIRSALYFNKLIEGNFPKGLGEYDCILSIPSHPLRKLRRFFHPADLFAKEVSKILKIKQLHFLKRVHYTRLQAELHRNERKVNIKGAFAVKNMPKNIESVLIIDDILTTGATVNEAAKTLKKAGIKRVELLVLSK